MRNRSSLLFHTLLGICFLFLFIDSFGYSPMQRVVFPLIVLGVAIFTSLIKVVGLLKPTWGKLFDPHGMVETGWKPPPGQFSAVLSSLSEKSSIPKSNPVPQSVLFLWILGTLLTIYLFGFMVGLGLSALVYVGFIDRGGWLPAVLMAIFVPTFLYLIFQVGLRVDIYTGLFW